MSRQRPAFTAPLARLLLLAALASPHAACDGDGAGGTCGNGVVENGEDCDGSDVATIYRGRLYCLYQGGRDIRIPCLPDCGLDFGICERAGTCGDGVLQPDYEVCDGALLGGADCVSLGHHGGTLACSWNCRYDVTGCERCGDDVVSPEYGEVCDPDVLCAELGLGNGFARCEDCAALDVSFCDAAYYLEVDSPHRILSAFVDADGRRWRAGFLTGALPAHANARAGCPDRFEDLLDDSSHFFPTDFWDYELMMSDCHDLFLQRLDEDHQVAWELQWGDPDAELPVAAFPTADGRVAVFALHAVIPEDPPVPQDAELPFSVRLHLVTPELGQVESTILFEKTLRLFEMKRPPVVGVSADGDAWTLLLDAAVDLEVAEPRILSGDFGRADPPTSQACPVAALHPGRVLDELDLRRAAGFGTGAFVVHGAMAFVQPEGETHPASAQVFLLDATSGACELPWTVEVGVGWGPHLHFSPMEEPGVLWGYEDRIYYSEPSREWRFTALGPQNVDGAFRTSLTQHPTHAVRRHDVWILTGLGDPGFDFPTLPECYSPSSKTWQILSDRIGYPDTGRGWSMCHTHLRMSNLLQTPLPDGAWWWTGTMVTYDDIHRNFSMVLPRDDRF